MSQENVDVVLAMVDAYNTGGVEPVMKYFAPDVEALPDAAFPEATPLHGRDEFREWVAQVASAWIRVRWNTIEVLAVDEHRVLNRGEWGGVGTTSGIETYSSITGVFTVADGLITHATYFFDHEQALKAVGLEE